jgi:hypothetical protein
LLVRPGAYPRRHLKDLPIGLALTLPSNSKTHWKGFPRANPLAYWALSSVTKKSSFLPWPPGFREIIRSDSFRSDNSESDPKHFPRSDAVRRVPRSLTCSPKMLKTGPESADGSATDFGESWGSDEAANRYRFFRTAWIVLVEMSLKIIFLCSILDLQEPSQVGLWACTIKYYEFVIYRKRTHFIVS